MLDTYICSDFYYGRLKDEGIDKNKCFIRCEISNGAMMGIIHFREDSIFIVNIEGDFYKFNCNTDKLYLKKYDHESGYDNLHYNPNHVVIKDMVYFSYGLLGKDQVEINEENGIKIEICPTKKTHKFFNVNKSDACEEL